jgi:pyruvate dehydrogenase (quinone)/pyruvate oxidase
MEALRTRQDKIRFVQVRHEESAAFMACAYAKFTRRLGVCLATSGPGGIHLLNGLYDAKLDHQPVLALTGLQFHDLIGTHTQLVDLACRSALAFRGVSHITMPVDFQEQEVN